jgi:hypothetical protein
MIIYDDRLEMHIEGFKDLLRSRNANLSIETGIFARIIFDFETAYTVVMQDGAVAGIISWELIKPSLYHLQVFAVRRLADCYEYMKTLTWFIIEFYRGKTKADVWIKNVDNYIFEGVRITPFLAEIIKKYGENDQKEIDNGPSLGVIGQYITGENNAGDLSEQSSKPPLEETKEDELSDLQQAGMAWVKRKKLAGNSGEFLKEWENLGGDYHTVDDLKRVLRQLHELGIIEKGSNKRWRMVKKT